MKRMVFTLVSVLCVVAPMAAQDSTAVETITVAVNDLDGEGVDVSATRLISERLRTEMFRTGAFTVVERGQMEDILKEQGFQQSGCTSDACVVEVGQILGVQQMVAGTVGQLGQLITLNVRLIDVGTGQITQSVNTDCRCAIEDVLTRSTPDIARKLAAAVTGKETAAPEQDGVALGKAVQAVSDEAPKAAMQSQLSIWPKLLFGVVALGGGAAGLVMNRLASQKIDDANAIAAQATLRPQDIPGLSPGYQSAWDEAHTMVILRNIAYGVGGAGVVGFGVSFAF